MSIYARRLQRNIGEKVEKGNNEESQNTLQVICKFPLKRHELRCCLLEWNKRIPKEEMFTNRPHICHFFSTEIFSTQIFVHTN